MAQEFYTPEGFPDMEDVKKGDTRKFLIEAECTDKKDGKMYWEIESIDGVNVEEKEEDDDTFNGYDESEDDDTDEDVSSDGKAKTTKGVGMLILSGKPK